MEYLEEKSPRAWPTYLLVAVFAIALLGLIGYALKTLLGDTGPSRKPIVHNISLLKPPPPPPPKPPEKKIEPEIKKEEVKVEQPKQEAPTPESPPPGEQLGVDAEGGAGSDGFGLIGNKGGHDLLSPGGFGFYTSRLQRHLQDELARNRKLKRADYRLVVRIWLGKSGNVQRVDLGGSTGDTELDETLRLALASASAMRDGPPETMPQPVRLRISNRGAG